MARLSEIFDLQMGKTPTRANNEYWENGTNRWVSIADLSGYEKYVKGTKEQITDKAVQESGIKVVPPDTVIMSFKLSLGKTAITQESLYTNEAIMAFIPKNTYNIFPDYFFYLLSNKDWSKGTNRAVMGATLNKSTIGEINVAIPSFEEQRRVVAILDKLSNVISLRKQQLAKIDKLVKARFAEMFGDPVHNEKSWKLRSLDSICSSIVDCPHSTPSYMTENTGYMCIRTSIVKKNQILWNRIEYISENEYYQRTQRKRPQKGDIVYTREGAILGIAAMIDKDCNVALGQRSMLLSPNPACCCSRFLCVAMNFDSFLHKALEELGGSASPHINVGDIKSFQIIMPPIQLQEKFADFAEKSNWKRLIIQQSLDKLEVLKKALVQEFFGGNNI